MKIKKILFLTILLVISFGLGAIITREYFPRVVEKPLIITEVRLIEYDNPELIEQSIRETSQKYGIEEKVFWAIIKCEGGHTFAWNKTWDGGLYQINWETAKRYGAKNLKDLVDPRLSTELAAKILQKEGLNPWQATRKCIEKELIFNSLKVEK